MVAQSHYPSRKVQGPTMTFTICSCGLWMYWCPRCKQNICPDAHVRDGKRGDECSFCAFQLNERYNDLEPTCPR